MTLEYWNNRYRTMGPEKTVGCMAWSAEDYERHTEAIEAKLWETLPIEDMPHDPVVLDFGCGVGRWLPILRAALGSMHYVGYDLSPLAIAEAIRRHGGHRPWVRFKVLTGRSFEEQTVNIIWCAFVLQHITDDEDLRRWLREFHAHMSPGGWIIALECMDDRLKDLHYIRYRPQSWYTAALEAAGFARVQALWSDKLGTDGLHTLMVARKGGGA